MHVDVPEQKGSIRKTTASLIFLKKNQKQKEKMR